MESITNQSFPETNGRQLGLKKIGRIVRNQRGEDLFGGKSDCFDKLSDFPQRYQTCQDTWRGTRKWNLVEIWLPNDSPIPPPPHIHTHTNFHSSCITFFTAERTTGNERGKGRKEERGKTVDSAFFSFSVIKPVKKLYFFAPSFNFLSKPICPRALPLRILSTCARPFGCAKKRIILRSYPWELRRELVKPVFCFQRNRNDSASASHFSLAHTSNPCVISTRDCAHFEPFPLYSTFRYSSSCFPRWFICV